MKNDRDSKELTFSHLRALRSRFQTKEAFCKGQKESKRRKAIFLQLLRLWQGIYVYRTLDQTSAYLFMMLSVFTHIHSHISGLAFQYV